MYSEAIEWSRAGTVEDQAGQSRLNAIGKSETRISTHGVTRSGGLAWFKGFDSSGVCR